MGKIIQIHEENQYIVKEKVVFYALQQEDPNKMIIWLEGGGVITNSYPDAKTAKDALDSFDKIMREPTAEDRNVDLEDSKKEELAQKYVDYTFKRHNIDPNSKEGQLIYHAYMHGMNQCLTQLKAQKGE